MEEGPLRRGESQDYAAAANGRAVGAVARQSSHAREYNNSYRGLFHDLIKAVQMLHCLGFVMMGPALDSFGVTHSQL